MRGHGDGQPPLVAMDRIAAIPGQFWRPRAFGRRDQARGGQGAATIGAR
jgi:hypothetical protein